MTPEEFLSKKGIKKSTYNAVRFVADGDKEYSVVDLLKEYAINAKKRTT